MKIVKQPLLFLVLLVFDLFEYFLYSIYLNKTLRMEMRIRETYLLQICRLIPCLSHMWRVSIWYYRVVADPYQTFGGKSNKGTQKSLHLFKCPKFSVNIVGYHTKVFFRSSRM